MAELRLLSGDKMETVVILMPDVWNLVPTMDEWAKLQEEQGVRTSTCCMLIIPENTSKTFLVHFEYCLSVGFFRKMSLLSLMRPHW